MAQLLASIQPSDAGQPRQVRIVIGDTVLLLPQAGATTFGTQLIELAAIARAQDAGATITAARPSLIVPQ